MIRSLSPLPYNLGSPCLVHTFIMEGTYQPGICHLTLTSFSWSTGFVLFASSFHDQVSFSTTYNLGLPYFGPHIDHGGTCQSGICHLTFTSFSRSADFVKFMLSFGDQAGFYNLGSPYLVYALMMNLVQFHYTLIYFLKNISHKQFAGGRQDNMSVYTCFMF